MAVPASPTTKNHDKAMPAMIPRPRPHPHPPTDYPPNSPTHHVVTRHPGGSYSSPRARHRGVLDMMMPSSPYGHCSVPVSPVAGSRLGSATGVPIVGAPPAEPWQQRKTMEAAILAERTRSTQCEKEEVSMTADELRDVLKKERRRTAKIAADLAAFKCSVAQQQFESEVFEEGRINGLMRRVDHLQHELDREEDVVSKQCV